MSEPTGVHLELPGLTLDISEPVCLRAIRWLTVATVAVTVITAGVTYFTT